MDGPWSAAIIAQRLNELGGEYSYNSGGLKTQVGRVNDSGDILTTGAEGYLVYGPYISLPKGNWRAEFSCDEVTEKSGNILIDVVCSGGKKVLSSQKIDLAKQNLNTALIIDFFLEESTVGIEIRIYVFAGTRLGIKLLKLAHFNPG